MEVLPGGSFRNSRSKISVLLFKSVYSLNDSRGTATHSSTTTPTRVTPHLPKPSPYSVPNLDSHTGGGEVWSPKSGYYTSTISKGEPTDILSAPYCTHGSSRGRSSNHGPFSVQTTPLPVPVRFPLVLRRGTVLGPETRGRDLDDDNGVSSF